jgi:exonuclease III
MKNDSRISLQWNMGVIDSRSDENSERLIKVLETMTNEIKPSIVFIQEAAPGTKEFLASKKFEAFKHKDRGLVTAFSKQDWITGAEDSPKEESRALGIRIDSISGRLKLAAWNIHALSRLHSQEDKIAAECGKFRDTLLRLRNIHGWSGIEEIIAGDFNLPPYHNKIYSEDGFFANRCLHRAMSLSKKSALDAPVFFNPTWVLLGLVDPPLGSYYKTGQCDEPWYCFDQILMTPNLAQPGQVKLVSKTGDTDLCTATQCRIPDKKKGSDHLPMCANFRYW